MPPVAGVHVMGMQSASPRRYGAKPAMTEISKGPTQYPVVEPEPLLLSRHEVDELYDMMGDLLLILRELQIPHIVVGGSLLGAVRSQSFLFNDEDMDIAILDDGKSYDRLQSHLPALLANAARKRNHRENTAVQYNYEYRPRVDCDRIRSSRSNNIWIDMFVMRKFDSKDKLETFWMGNDLQEGLILDFDTIFDTMEGPSFPLYHYDNREAIERRPRQYFERNELNPVETFSFGPLKVPGPSCAKKTLERFYGSDCFTHFTRIHRSHDTPAEHSWEDATKVLLTDDEYLPIQHSQKRKHSFHSRNALELYLMQQDNDPDKPEATIRDSPPTDDEFSPVCVSDLMSRRESEIMPVKEEGLGSMRKSRSLFSLSVPSTPPVRRQLPTTLAEEPNSTAGFALEIRQETQGQADGIIFDKNLRETMEPYLRKARLKREQSRHQIDFHVHESIASSVGVPYTALRSERRFLYDEHTYPIHQALAETIGVKDLQLLHEHEIQDKRLLFAPLLDKYRRFRFHECYDNFVTSFCIPLIHEIAMQKNVFYTTSPRASSKIVYRYQAFPCVRVVRPGEVSMEPHCDTALGHSIGYLNFHIPLTPTYGTNALYTESHPGREDWHPMTSKALGLGYLFDGARCLHFGLENMTEHTRVSLGFRIAIYRDDQHHVDNSEADDYLCSKHILEDDFSKAGPGYYEEAVIDIGAGPFSIPGSNVAKKHGYRLLNPDERVGFPFQK
mmetsp:Transcript_7447/g.10572  ORF Transcript_7447/g.10572 Transcript_7447/m.10572 type:complete len:728 (-) Transcript_7447:1163-3346(-)